MFQLYHENRVIHATDTEAEMEAFLDQNPDVQWDHVESVD